MKFARRAIAAKLLIIVLLLVGCQAVVDKLRIESDKDAAVSKEVKELLLKDKGGDLTGVKVKTTDGSVDLSGTVPSLDARGRAVKLAWKASGVQTVVNHLEVKE
jgi:osmotically-inducible protein OsmY